MKRVKLTVAYDGTEYSGWQVQPNATTIEGELNRALTQLSGAEIRVIGASRTDAGVHAMGNVAVFDTEATIPPNRYTYALNSLLPDDIVVVESEEVAADFHPRHCDTVKTYEYTYDNNTFPNPLTRRYAWHVSHSLDIEAMNNAAAILVGEHDFKSFCCVRTQAESTVRTIYSLTVEKKSDNSVILRVTGNGFLYNMVRIIAGTLSMVGTGLWTVEQVRQALDATDRTSAGLTAPPQGLRLVKIDYKN